MLQGRRILSNGIEQKYDASRAQVDRLIILLAHACHLYLIKSIVVTTSGDGYLRSGLRQHGL